MKLTEHHGKISGAVLYDLTGGRNTLIIGPPQSGKTRVLSALARVTAERADVAERWLLGATRSEISPEIYKDMRRTIFDDPRPYLGELRGAMRERQYERPDGPKLVVLWDNLSIFQYPEELDKVARLSGRYTTQVIAVINSGIETSTILSKTSQFFPVRIVMAPHRIRRSHMERHLDWYGLNGVEAPTPCDYPDVPGFALLSADPAAKPLGYAIDE
ncbi:hypothetical protein [Microbispora sp. NPDC049125]|uniref:hypothetical protein n=1 Tax=Microbispora sp. NPDC049125 TaxID=3154929 RepID=UPI003465F88E